MLALPRRDSKSKMNPEDSTSASDNNLRLPKSTWGIGAFSGLIFIGFIDYLTGNELMLSVFYLLPISLAALKVGTPMALILAVISAAVESVVNIWAAGFYGSSIVVHFWNTGILLLIYIYIAVLVSTLRRAHEGERERARKDYLTGIRNFQGFKELAEREIERSRRYGTVLSAAYIDCDNFKEVNDTLGHDAGSGVLRAIAGTIQSHIRATDIAARIGGDEFVVLLTDISHDISIRFVEKMRSLLLEVMKRNNWNVTFSIGMVSFLTPPLSVDEMLKKSDALMYCVKKETKNAIKHEVV